MKLDMSKAYDHVEWPFFKAIMDKLGFAVQWTNLVMRCVISISYAVMINCVPSDRFVPSRSLKEGDLLLPYLFILCAKAFADLIRKAKNDGIIHGI